MGKYSKALEKAKDDAERQYELNVEQVSHGEKVMEVDKSVTSPQPSPPENISPSISDQSDISNEMDGWDEKLREIISGSAKQVAESIRMFRTKIFYPKSGQPPRSILVTSAIPGEGKSFVCANLGMSIAQGLEKEALLVECDLRRPSLSKLLGLANSRGLVDYLQSGVPIEQLIQQTSMPKLSVLASGKPPKNPAELIDTEKMKSLIDDLEKQNLNRLIIFDSPPIQAAAETDILAKMVDKVVLVVRWGYARREHTKQLIEMLGRDKILGVIFNAFEMNRLESKLQGYYYGYKDYYSSGYTKYYEKKPRKKKGNRSSS
ncbi:CpsD/CapB family tyrosine-protein kinase [Thermodesulfobacteriota bacterium]